MTSPHPPERASATLRAIPRIDLDTASREKLVAHIEHLEWMLGDMVPSDDGARPYRLRFGLTVTQAKMVVALHRRGHCTRELLRAVSLVWGGSDNLRTVDAIIWHVRRKLKPFGIEIKNDWGVGYILPEDSARRLHSLLSERAAA